MIKIHRRPEFAHWRWTRNLTNRTTAALLEQAAARAGVEGFSCSHEWVRRICLPFDHPQREVPQGDLLKAIGLLTEGEIDEGDFFPLTPELAR